MDFLIGKIAKELSFKEHQVNNAVKLLFEEECTIPFVARYRKELTGSLDEVALRDIRDRYQYLSELEATKERYLKVVEKHCNEKPELKAQWPALKARFEACETKQALEDLYLPFKPKRRTRAIIAKEKGLEPLLEKILDEAKSLNDLNQVAAAFVTPEDSDTAPALRVKSAEEALQGASDIYAERIAENADYRSIARQLSHQTGLLVSKKLDIIEQPEELTAPAAKSNRKPKKNAASKYENYFDYKESINTAASHRIMAVRRGEAEKILKVSIEVDKEDIISELKQAVLGAEPCTDEVKAFISSCVEDAYKRLISPSMETELRLQLKSRAEEDAITVFSDNLKNLLLLPPIPGKTVMGIDPGIRTGSKIAVVDDTGKLLGHTTVYPDPSGKENDKTKSAQATIAKLLAMHKVEYVAIGNGTGSREIGKVVQGALKSSDEFKTIRKLVVNEAGASVYSADEIAREEFPDLDATIRSAISIARRLQDPLAELVKIEPRSIGVGQYQHDVNPNKLTRSLGEVVESCVNKVGVNLNTASFSLLSYVSGLNKNLAKSIVKDREEKGKFTSREDLKRVSGFGPKAYQQGAGFLRVPESKNPLDNSAVHPESYALVEAMARDLSKDLREIIGSKETLDALNLENYVSATTGMETLKDISRELLKPGRDPREDGTRLVFSDDVSEVEDLKAGMTLPGTVTNVTNFGAFVDIGVHQDGLVHISELSDDFVDDPAKVVSVGQVLKVRVLDVDIKRRRISLSCKSAPEIPARKKDAQSPANGKFSRPSKRGPLKQRSNSGTKSRPQRSQKQYTIEDLMAKFNKN